MADPFYLDIETFCETPISVGAHRYAERAEVMVVSWAFGDGDPDVVDLTTGCSLPTDVVDAIRDPAVRIIGHNFGNFDRTVLRHRGIEVDPSRIHDTMVQAMAHGLPGGLEKLGVIFGIGDDEAKLKSGKALIQLFCKPRPKNMTLRRATRLTHPAEWADFLEYAKRDIPAMRYIFKHMPKWNYPGDPANNRYQGEYQNWLLDQAINDRGFLVDQDLARAAMTAVAKAEIVMNDRTDEMTDGDVERTSQRDKLLAHLLAVYGVSLPDMTKSTLERRVNDPELPAPVRELLAIRLDVTTTSNSKYKALLNSVSADGRLRGTLQFCGAPRTRRDAGRVFQPQNLPRPDMTPQQIDAGIVALKTGSAHLLFDSPIKLASNALRGSIVAAPERKLVVGDLEQIEARVLPWLAGEQWKLDAFRAYDAGEGPDLYCASATRLMGREIGKKDPERQSHGKVVELACGYGGALGAFRTFAAVYGVEMADSDAKAAVDAWRAANPAIADWDDGLWAKLNRAAFSALHQPGTVFEVNGKVSFEKWRSWLRFTLPSGATLCYADPQIIEDPRMPGKMTLSYMGMNNYTRKWERLTTYGGKLSADATQSTARDIMWSGAQRLAQADYEIILRCHDELVMEVPDDPSYSLDFAIKQMTHRFDYIDDNLPLAAAGFEAYRYRK